MKVIFLGTPELSVPSLNAVARRHDVRLAVTQPDRRSGRGRRLASSPVKIAAVELGIPLWQPEGLRGGEAVDKLRGTGADILAVVAYGLLIPDTILEAFPHGAVNLHFSLLPAYRGAGPIKWALIRGEPVTGVTTFRLTSVMDGGPTYLKHPVAVEKGETAGELGVRLAGIGAGVLADTLDGIESGSLRPEPQDERGASRAPKLKKEDGRIDWSLSATEIVNLVRGVNPWPGAFAILDGEALKVWRAEPVLLPETDALPPGTVVTASPRTGLIVAAGSGAVSLTEIQAEGKRRMAAKDYLAGHHLKPGTKLA